jgi:hypothetical protein
VKKNIEMNANIKQKIYLETDQYFPLFLFSEFAAIPTFPLRKLYTIKVYEINA